MVIGIRFPQRWQPDTADLSQLDTVLAHLTCFMSANAYYENADDIYRSVLGVQEIQRVEADPLTIRPQAWWFNVADVNYFVSSGISNYTDLARLLVSSYYWHPTPLPADQLAGNYWTRAAEWIWSALGEKILADMILRKTIFTGHSLGGAIAHLLYAFAKAAPGGARQPSTVYSYGAPRVGNGAFRTFTGGTFCVNVPGDLVPKLPPRGFIRPTFPTIFDLRGRTVTPGDPFRTAGIVVDLMPNGECRYSTESLAGTPETQGLEVDLIESWFTANVPGADLVTGSRSFATIFGEGLRYHLSETSLARLEKSLPGGDEQNFTFPDATDKLTDKLVGPVTVEPENVVPWQPTAPPPTQSTGANSLRVRRRH